MKYQALFCWDRKKNNKKCIVRGKVTLSGVANLSKLFLRPF